MLLAKFKVKEDKVAEYYKLQIRQIKFLNPLTEQDSHIRSLKQN